jgi:sugar phosphate isomerase/epimerase
MRLGGYYMAETIHELRPLMGNLQANGLSAVQAPLRLLEMSDAECAAYGEEAARLDVVVGEFGYWKNLVGNDASEVAKRVEELRAALRKADIMQVRNVVIVAGSAEGAEALSAGKMMMEDEGKVRFAGVLNRILDGYKGEAKLTLEPWYNSFLYKADEAAEFLEMFGSSSLKFHWDHCNMVSRENYFYSTKTIERNFDILRPWISSVHFKDSSWRTSHLGFFLDEVEIGRGSIDYDTLIKKVDELGDNMTCYCEHLDTEQQYVDNFMVLHQIARRNGLSFKATRGGMNA